MKLKFNSRKSRKGAFTLIEILLVLVIIGLVATALVVNLMPQQAGAERKAAEILIKSIKNSLNTYKLNVGNYPTEEEGGLLALLQKPEFENWFTSQRMLNSNNPKTRTIACTLKGRTESKATKTTSAIKKHRTRLKLWMN